MEKIEQQEDKFELIDNIFKKIEKSEKDKSEKIYEFFIILNLFAIFILFSIFNLILFTIAIKYIDIEILITNIKIFFSSINTIFIDNKVSEKIFEIFLKLGDKIIPHIYNFFNAIL